MLEIVQRMFSDYSEIKLKIDNRRKFEKLIIIWKLNTLYINYQKNHNTNYKILWDECTQNSPYQNLWYAVKEIFRGTSSSLLKGRKAEFSGTVVSRLAYLRR